MYGGAIASRGPRYCPSVEDKVVKFPDAERHQLFLEPEGHDTHELYVNGLSTSLPVTVQLEVLRTVKGLERVRMTRAGYAIEYDYYPPTQLDASLQSRAIAGLWFAGQVNGTTGYEEAAGQGVMAGLNAARWVQEREPIVLGRETSYIGVLVDDLVTRGVDEPYRLFTSRSEFRLTVRQDNAVSRLASDRRSMPACIRTTKRAIAESRVASVRVAMELADATSVTPERARRSARRAANSAPLAHAVRAVRAGQAHGRVVARGVCRGRCWRRLCRPTRSIGADLETQVRRLLRSRTRARRARARDGCAGAGGGTGLPLHAHAVHRSATQAATRSVRARWARRRRFRASVRRTCRTC